MTSSYDWSSLMAFLTPLWDAVPEEDRKTDAIRCLAQAARMEWTRRAESGNCAAECDLDALIEAGTVSVFRSHLHGNKAKTETASGKKGTMGATRAIYKQGRDGNWYRVYTYLENITLAQARETARYLRQQAQEYLEHVELFEWIAGFVAKGYPETTTWGEVCEREGFEPRNIKAS